MTDYRSHFGLTGAVALAVLAGCVQADPPMDAAQWAAVAEWAKTPQGYAHLEMNCRMNPFTDRAAMAELMGVPEHNAHLAFCQRVTKAVAEGIIPPAEMSKMARGELDEETARTMIRALAPR